MILVNWYTKWQTILVQILNRANQKLKTLNKFKIIKNKKSMSKLNKETIEQGLAKLNDLLKTAGKVTIIVVAMTVGFISGEIYHNYQTHIKMSNMQAPKNAEITSVAINERGELMMIDRKNGAYTLYDAPVGDMIFKLYANRIYSQHK